MLKNIFMIVAMTNKTNAIGINGHMIYHLPQDLKYFKNTTINHTIVCGKKTYLSFPKRPLPNRKNLILTRSDEKFENAQVLKSKEELIQYAKNHQNESIFIVGGDSIYHQFLDLASKLYITEIEENIPVKADTFFPKFNKNEWIKESESEYFQDLNSPKYKFIVYKRV